jgi:hypothetical protein
VSDVELVVDLERHDVSRSTLARTNPLEWIAANRLGALVGQSVLPNNANHGFVWTP